MDIPAGVMVPLCIKQGAVFNFRMDLPGTGGFPKNRYFVVLNRAPRMDRMLLVLTSTTQIARKIDFARRAGVPSRTIVIITPKEYPVFRAESAFNCNDVYEISMADLVRKIEHGGSANYPVMPAGVLSRIAAGVRASPRVPSALKTMI